MTCDNIFPQIFCRKKTRLFFRAGNKIEEKCFIRHFVLLLVTLSLSPGTRFFFIFFCFLMSRAFKKFPIDKKGLHIAAISSLISPYHIFRVTLGRDYFRRESFLILFLPFRNRALFASSSFQLEIRFSLVSYLARSLRTHAITRRHHIVDSQRLVRDDSTVATTSTNYNPQLTRRRRAASSNFPRVHSTLFIAP